MKSALAAALRWIVLPWGTTSGRRIVLNGVDGLIQVYDTLNRLRLELGNDTVLGSVDSMTCWSAAADEVDGAEFGAADQTGTSWGRVSATILSPRVSSQVSRARIDVSSSPLNPGTDRPGIRLTSILATGVDVDIDAATLAVADGANRPMGVATLVAGSVVVANTAVTASSRIFVSRQASGGTPGHLSVTRVAGVSLTIASSSALDTSTVAFLILEPS